MSDCDELIRLAAKGDRDAQRQLYELFGERVYRIVWRVVGESNAEDVMQDTFLRLFERLSTFRYESAFTTWLHRFAVNEALQYLRRSSRPTEKTKSLDGIDVPERDPAVGNDHADLLETALSQIDPELRLIFEMKERDLLPYSEISQVMAIPEGTVASRLNRARKDLRNQLVELGWEP